MTKPHSPAEIARWRAETLRAAVSAARQNSSAFVAYVMRDEAGQPLKNAPFHHEWHALLARHKRLILWGSAEVGKSLNLVGYCAWLLGRDPTLRIVIASRNKDKAAQLLSLLVHLMISPRYREVFPGTVILGANVHTLRVLGWDGKNPSVQAYQYRAPIMGNRVDVAIFDDILDRMNTRTEEQRTEQYLFYKDTYINRFTARGQCVFISNAWHPRDLMHRFMHEVDEATGRKIWCTRRYPIWWPDPTGKLEAETCEDVQTSAGPVRMRALWPAQWPISRIVAKRAEYAGNLLYFQRTYECIPLDDSASSWDRAWIDEAERQGRGLSWVRSLQECYGEEFRALAIGVDLATARPHARRKTDESVFTVVGQKMNGKKRLLRVESGRLHGPQIVQRVRDLRQRFHPAIPWLEGNGAQIFVKDFCQVPTYDAWGQPEDPIPVRSFDTTTQNKYDPRFGVEALGTEMAGGSWEFPNEQHAQKDPEYLRLVDEMMGYDPTGHTGDRLMSLWIASEGLRLMRSGGAQVLQR